MSADKGKRGAFGSALEKVRKEAGQRLDFLLSSDAISRAIDVSKGVYDNYEYGTRQTADHGFLVRVMEFYEPYQSERDRLAAGFKRRYGVPNEVRNILDVARESNVAGFAAEVDRLRRVTLELYDLGRVVEADYIASHVWQFVIREPNVKGSHEFARMYARVRSQTGDHRGAIKILNDSIETFEPEAGPPDRCRTLLAMATVKNRANSVTGIEAVRTLNGVEASIREMSGLSDPVKDAKWRSVWNAVQRGRINALTDSIYLNDKDHLRYVRGDFESTIQYSYQDNEKLANELIRTRIDSILEDPPTGALTRLNELAGRLKAFGDRAFLARSRTIALFSSSNLPEARSEAMKWIHECQQTGMTHKKWQFQFLVDQMNQLGVPFASDGRPRQR